VRPGAGPAGLAGPAAVTVERYSPARPLEPAAERWLQQGLVRALPDLRLDHLFAVRPTLFRDVEDLVVPVDAGTGEPLGALGSRWVCTAGGDRVLHIGVQFVAQRRRGESVFGRSWWALLEQVVRRGGFPRISALKTYNPVAYCAMRAYGRLPGAVLFPDVQRVHQDAPTRALATELAAVLAPGHPYDPDSGVLHGVGVPRDLYRTRPTCDDADVNGYFGRVTRPGDRVLCVLHVRDRATEAAILDLFGRRGGPAGAAATRG
jgi:hypothetical protein